MTYPVRYDSSSAPKLGAVFNATGAFSQKGKELQEQRFQRLFERLLKEGAIHRDSMLAPRIFGPHEAMRVADEFAAARVDVMLICNSAFPNGHVFPTIALHPQLSRTPLILTADAEPELGDSEWTTNAWCGVIMNNYVAKRLGRRVRPLPGNPDSERYCDELRMLLNCSRAIALLRRDLLGRFGDAPGGFHSATMDQFVFLHTFGTQQENVDLLSLIETYRSGKATGLCGEASFSEAEAEATTQEMRAGRSCHISEEHLRRGARLYHALRAQVQANGFTSVAVKCWPELLAKDLKIAACFPMTWLMTKGDVWSASCESDTATAVMQSLAALLTGRPAACLDFVNYTGHSSCVELGHCGVGIAGLMGDDEAIAYKSPDRQGGEPDHAPALIGQFAYGPKTGLAITQTPDGELKVLTFTGESNPETALHKQYSAADVLVEEFRELNEMILEHGFAHHLAVAMADITLEVKEVCAFLGVCCVSPGTARVRGHRTRELGA
jgi:L-fucose isomerase-like protein